MPDLEREIKLRKDFYILCNSDKFCKDLYASLCNMRWLKEGETEPWSCSWRYAGGIVAELRFLATEEHGDYLDFYCSGNEGQVNPVVESLFNDMGWTRCPWED